MFYKSLVLIVVSAGSAIAQTLLTVQTPASLIQCEPALLAWSGGQGPYFIAAIPGGQSAAAALMNFGQHNGTSLTWTVNVTAGTSVSLKITDATGATNYDQAVTVQAGSDTSCLADDSFMAATSSATSAAEAVTSSTSAGAAGVDAAATSITSAASSITSAVSSETATVANAVTSAKSSVSAAISSASSKAVSATSPAASASSSSHSGAMPVFDVSAGLLAVGISAMGLAWL